MLIKFQLNFVSGNCFRWLADASRVDDARINKYPRDIFQRIYYKNIFSSCLRRYTLSRDVACNAGILERMTARYVHEPLARRNYDDIHNSFNTFACVKAFRHIAFHVISCRTSLSPIAGRCPTQFNYFVIWGGH